MENNIKFLRLLHQMTQTDLADKVNEVVNRRPELRKPTKKNPDGVTDQQTIGRIENNLILLDQRWLEIFREIFNVSYSTLISNVEYQNKKEDLWDKYMEADEPVKMAVDALLKQKKGD